VVATHESITIVLGIKVETTQGKCVFPDAFFSALLHPFYLFLLCVSVIVNYSNLMYSIFLNTELPINHG
jgi:hypothetical protein